MNSRLRLLAPAVLVMTALAYAAEATNTAAATAGATAPRDGSHDFDFNLGTWHTHIRRLIHPLTSSTEWAELDGTVTVHPVWSGRGQIEEIEADGPNGHFEGLTLFLYNPQSHQWSQTFANSNDGMLGAAEVGEFRDGRGELIQQDTFQGRVILVRAVWSDISPDAHRFEQSFSDDGGRTWQANFIGTLTRQK
jgi:hypothetical protein